MIEKIIDKMAELSVADPFKNESKEVLTQLAIEIIKLEKLEAIRDELQCLYDVANEVVE